MTSIPRESPTVYEYRGFGYYGATDPAVHHFTKDGMATLFDQGAHTQHIVPLARDYNTD